MIEINNIVKSFGDFTAINDLSIKVKDSSIYADLSDITEQAKQHCLRSSPEFICLTAAA
jgi:ABC-type uncharacterized transport system ATPase subunit